MVREPWLWVCVLVCALASSCSFVLDPDELVAERQEVTGDTVGDSPGPDGEDGEDGDSDGGDGVALDAQDTRDPEDVIDTEDARETLDTEDALDTGDHDDGNSDDTAEPLDTDEPDLVQDSEIADTLLVDVDTNEVIEDTSIETDQGPEVQLIVRTSGDGDCTLDYYLQNVTSCPKTCGWTLVFDARSSRGLSAFSWRFAVSGGYIITPESSVGAVASVVISTPACLLFPAGSMRPATVTASVSADGGPWLEAATIPFSVRQVAMCGASMCEAP